MDPCWGEEHVSKTVPRSGGSLGRLKGLSILLNSWLLFILLKRHTEKISKGKNHAVQMSVSKVHSQRGHRDALNSPTTICSVVCQGSFPEPKRPGFLSGVSYISALWLAHAKIPNSWKESRHSTHTISFMIGNLKIRFFFFNENIKMLCCCGSFNWFIAVLIGMFINSMF